MRVIIVLGLVLLVGCGGGGASRPIDSAPASTQTSVQTEPQLDVSPAPLPEGVIYEASGVIPPNPTQFQRLPLNIPYEFQRGARYRFEIVEWDRDVLWTVSFSPAVYEGPDFFRAFGWFEVSERLSQLDFSPIETKRQDLRISRGPEGSGQRFRVRISKLRDPLPPPPPLPTEIFMFQWNVSISEGETYRRSTPEGYGYYQGRTYEVILWTVAETGDLTISIYSEGSSELIARDDSSGVSKTLRFTPTRTGRYDVVIQSRRGAVAFYLRIKKSQQ